MADTKTDTNSGKQTGFQAAAGTGGSAAPLAKMKDGLKTIDRDYKEKSVLDRARKMGISYVNLTKTPINPDLLKMLTPDVVKKAMAVPFFRIGKRVRIAVTDPNNAETKKVIDDLKKQKFLINTNLASEESIQDILKLYDTDQYKVKKELDTKYAEEKIEEYEKELANLSELKAKVENVTAEEGLNLINMGAMKTGASDIHFEPGEGEAIVRFRIDGMLHKVFGVDLKTYHNLSNQIKYISKLKLNINNIPQDGRFSFALNERKIDVRVSDIPTQFGESFVFRLLDSSRGLLTYDQMGFQEDYLQMMKNLQKMNNGMILCTGPTGSGKTTTLYSILDQFNDPEAKIITLEDPIEYNLKGIVQSQINEKRDYTFGGGLRAVLRQDPDVVMIGEVRDIDTAQTASQAALTGHVVLSTLHTNSAVETIPRLINMGLPPFMVAPALHTIIAQRLVRRICPDCKEMKAMPESLKKDIDDNLSAVLKIKPNLKLDMPDKLPFAKGCAKCSHTGYRGRILVTEIINLDYEIKDLILKEESSNNILLAARRKGLITMREDGILKVLQGLTTIEEVFRVTSVSS